VKYRDTSTYDHQKGWFLPDDYLGFEEHPDDAAGRILREQAGLAPGPLRLGFVESFGNGVWHLVFHYVTEIPETPEITPGPNVAASRWFDLHELPSPSEVAHEGWGLDVLQRVLSGGS